MRSHLGAGVAAGIIVFLITALPVLLIAWAGSSGSVGDLSQVEFLGVGLAVAIVIAVSAGHLATWMLRRVDGDPKRRALDAWAAYFVGLALFIFLISLVPVVIMGLLLPDDSQSLDDRLVWIELVWVGGYLLAGLLGGLAGRAFLGRSV